MDKLSADSMAAREAGMSYGKYMALNHKPVERKPEPVEDGGRVCKICGAKFFTARPNQLCCSSKCSTVNNRVRARERAEQIYAEKRAQHGKQV